MRRLLLCLLITILLVFTTMLPASVAAGEAAISGAAVNAAPGETVDLAVSVTNNPGIAAYLIYVQCDTDLFSVAYDSGAGTYDIVKGGFSPAGTMISNTYEDRGWQVIWFNTQNVQTDGALFTVKLTVSATAPAGKYPVKVSYDGPNTIDVDGNPVAFKCIDGSVTVSGQGGSTGSGTPPASDPPSQPGAGTSAPPPAATGDPGDSSLFSDVPRSHWAYEFISLLVGRGVVDGVGDNLFAPEEKVSRAAFVKMLAGVAGADVSGYTTSLFDDVSPGDWFLPYVAWAAEKGYVNGKSESRFSPGDSITREEIATVIWRWAAGQGIILPADKEAMVFKDEAKISGYAKEAVAAMQQAGIVGGYSDGAFRPQGNATRAEAAKMLAALMKIVED